MDRRVEVHTTKPVLVLSLVVLFFGVETVSGASSSFGIDAMSPNFITTYARGETIEVTAKSNTTIESVSCNLSYPNGTIALTLTLNTADYYDWYSEYGHWDKIVSQSFTITT